MRPVPSRLRHWIAVVLRWGSYLAAALLLVGLVWVMTDSDVPIQAGPPMLVEFLPVQLTEGNPYAVMQLGLLLLLATPLVRVILSGVLFGVEREPQQTLLSLAVLLIILAIVLLTGSG